MSHGSATHGKKYFYKEIQQVTREIQRGARVDTPIKLRLQLNSAVSTNTGNSS